MMIDAYRATICRYAVLASAALMLIAATCKNPAFAAPEVSAPVLSVVDRWSFADLADVIAEAPIVAVGRVIEAVRVPEVAPKPAHSGAVRYYMVAEVVTLIRGPAGGVPPRVAWLVDLPVDARGKVGKLKNARIIVAAQLVAGRPGELLLVTRDAVLPWSAALEARARTVVGAVLAADAPPRITGVTSAFHVAGTLPGESETQVFLATATRTPVSMSILRRPGVTPSVSIAFGEIVDEAAAVPRGETLGWYRLACFLPPAMPDRATSELSSDDANAARADYRLALALIGACERNRR